ncbi:MAG TPA: rhodanese-like domain-containing protein [Chitinophagales bacterium]|nr:rhodanese-like domain-containing protein [Chitinophagales bacterium]
MKEISVEELKSRLDKGEDFHLIDVREPWEYEEFNIGAKNLPLSSFMSFIPELEDWKEEEIVVHCKMGGRSMQAVAILEQMGFKNVKNVTGGMEEWKLKFPK